MNETLRNFDLIKYEFSSNTKRKHYFLCTCFVLDPNINLEERDQKFPFGGLIGYGNSCMDDFFANSKIFRLHAILNDAAGSVNSTTYRGTLVSLMFYLDFQVLVFLVTCLGCSSVKIFASSVYALFDC